MCTFYCWRLWYEYHFIIGVDKVALEQCITTKLLDLTSVSSNHSQPFSNTTSSPPTASSQANGGVHAGDATVSPRLENIRSPRNVNQAIYARDSMAKAIYQVREMMYLYHATITYLSRNMT